MGLVNINHKETRKMPNTCDSCENNGLSWICSCPIEHDFFRLRMKAFGGASSVSLPTNAPPSLSVSLPTSSHIKTFKSKFNFKCRPAYRLLSRRFYFHRYKSPSTKSKTVLIVQRKTRRICQLHRELSPCFANLSELEKSLLTFVAEHPNRRSYSTDSDPLHAYHYTMNKSAFFNHSLMKRRYSVPETVMRKHKLQETRHRNHSVDSQHTSDPKVKDESCQTEEFCALGKPIKSNKKRERDVRYFRKSKSYCQYKSLRMFHKRMLPSSTDSHSLASFESRESRTPTFIREVNSTNLQDQILDVDVTNQTDHKQTSKCSSPTSHLNQTSNLIPPKSTGGDNIENRKSVSPSTNGYNTHNGSRPTTHETRRPQNITPPAAEEPINDENEGDQKTSDHLLPITFHSESVYMHPYQQGYLSHKELHHISIQVIPELKTTKPNSTPSDYYKTEIKVNLNDTFKNNQHERNGGADLPSENPAVNEALESSDGCDPFSKSESSQMTENKTGENVMIIPEKLKNHKYLLVVPQKQMNPEHLITQTTPKKLQNHKHLITVRETPKLHKQLIIDPKNNLNPELNLNNFTNPTTNKNFLETDTLNLLNTSSDFQIISPQEDDQDLYLWQTDGLFESNGSSNIISNCPKSINYDSRSLEDCAVPIHYYPHKITDEQLLKVQNYVGDTNMSEPLGDVLLGPKVSNFSLPPESRTKVPAGKHSSRLALNYLFQKLGDSYPTRPLLKQPVFLDYSSQYSPYYSDLPANLLAEIHPQVLYNNQTYHVLSDNVIHREKLKPNSKQRSAPIPDLNIAKQADSNDHSDSDISIADSLEDLQQKPKIENNKYQKYDNKLTRGNIPTLPPKISKNKKNGISYFLQLRDNETRTFTQMPDRLVKKLQRRRNQLSKHILCLEVPKRHSRSKKLIHKQVQTCLNSEDSLKKRRKMVVSPSIRDHQQQINIDQKIADILMAGLKLQEAGENETAKVEKKIDKVSVSISSLQTDNQENLGRNEVGDEKLNKESFYSNVTLENNLYESVLSEEEIAKVNSNNYYRTFKKSKRIYYPNKTADKNKSNVNGGDCENNQPPHAPTFSKYQRRLRGFKEQMRQNSESSSTEGVESLNRLLREGPSISCSSRISSSREKVSKMKSLSKIPGPKNSQRFYQRFEAIPEEISNSSFENQDVNGNSNCLIQKSENGNVKQNPEDLEQKKDMGGKIGNKLSEQKCVEIKSSKGRNSLNSTNEHEELITLSKGWINFYLLKENTGDENETTEEIEDKNVARSETYSIPHKYSYQIQAVPRPPDGKSQKSTCTLPGLSKLSRKLDTKSEKSDKLETTSFPGIESFSCLNRNSSFGISKTSQKKKLLTQNRKIGDESEEASSYQSRLNGWQEHESVSDEDAAFVERSLSSTTTCSNPSESPVEERKLRFSRYQRPHTYHLPHNGNKWLLTLGGSNNESDIKMSEIELQLCLKNDRCRRGNQHSWKFTIGGQESNTGDSQTKERVNCPSRVNVNYKLTSSINYETHSIISYSENNSRRSSVCSFTEKKKKSETISSSMLSGNPNKLNEFKLLQKSEDDLTITGSAITPERKPRVPTMSERDLTRMKLIKPIGNASPL